MRRLFLFLGIVWVSLCHSQPRKKAQNVKTNVIFILADDLGYGDLGWGPFSSTIMANVKTPALRKMADNGLTLTNFHSAAPICSPARASIMVGLFPWRMGVDFIYAGDLKKDGSEELDHEQLPMIPNIATSFHDAGYYTAHIGKWHLGGQSHIDIPTRLASNFANCTVPGINQYGFDEYVGMSEGTNSDRYKTHQKANTYATGANYLVRNDVPLPKKDIPGILTDRQADEAIRVIRQQTEANTPFFMNVWFDAPHSPWEPIEPFYTSYLGKFESERNVKYASMITNMDMNIGRILDVLDELKIAENTLVMFTSDNGPESEAGSAGKFKGGKRLLSEGGIRVPAIVQWKGKIAPGGRTNKFAVSTDLFPTFVHAAKLRMPAHIRIDGVSILPMLLAQPSVDPASLLFGDERVVLWYTHSIGISKFSAAWSHGFKVLMNDYEGRPSINLPATLRMFDMRNDPTETTNLAPMLQSKSCSTLVKSLSALQSNKRPTSDYQVVSWRDIAGLNNFTLEDEQMLRLLQLFNHLHMKTHLFRHDGEQEWLLYHANKPYVSDPTCAVRTSNVPTFSWSTSHILAPEFCGESVYNLVGKPACRCSLLGNSNSCAAAWTASGDGGTGKKRSGWTSGLLYPGIAGFTPTMDKRSLGAQLNEMLQVTRFKSLCGESYPVALQQSYFHDNVPKIIPSEQCSVVRTHSSQQVASTFLSHPTDTGGGREKRSELFFTWAAGDLRNKNAGGSDRETRDDNNQNRKLVANKWMEFWSSSNQTNSKVKLVSRQSTTTAASRVRAGSPTSRSVVESSSGKNDNLPVVWSRQCHQRVNRRHNSKGFYLSGSGCGVDAPVLVQNYPGMPFPLRLCPESFDKLKRQSRPYFDDNAMLVALNQLIEDSLIQGGITRNKIAIIDPLVIPYLATDARLQRVLSDLAPSSARGQTDINEKAGGAPHQQLQQSRSEAMESALRHVWHLLGYSERKLNNNNNNNNVNSKSTTAALSIELLLLPILIDDVWSIAMLDGVDPVNKFDVSHLYYHPLSSSVPSAVNWGATIEKQQQFTQLLLTRALNVARPLHSKPISTHIYQSQSHDSSTSSASSSSVGSVRNVGDNVDDLIAGSGSRVLQFVASALQEIQKSRLESRALVPGNIRMETDKSTDISASRSQSFSMTSLIDSLTRQSKRAKGYKLAYWDFMSAIKVGPEKVTSIQWKEVESQ